LKTAGLYKAGCIE